MHHLHLEVVAAAAVTVQHHLLHHLLTLTTRLIPSLIPPTMNSCRRQVHRLLAVEQVVLLDLQLAVVGCQCQVLGVIVRNISTVHKECLGIFLLIRWVIPISFSRCQSYPSCLVECHGILCFQFSLPLWLWCLSSSLLCKKGNEMVAVLCLFLGFILIVVVLPGFMLHGFMALMREISSVELVKVIAIVFTEGWRFLNSIPGL